MRYADIADTHANRFRLPPSHPVLAEITIDPMHWHDLQRLDANDPTILVVGHDIPQNGRMVVHVACVSHAVRDRLGNALLGLMDATR